MKISDFIVEYFTSKGIDTFFGYIGGAITHLVDSVYKNNNAKFIQVYHEQSAAIAAEGYARYSGKPGIALATSGPGATNLITGIADAYFDSIPTIYITGQVNTYEYKYDKPVRQQGFQETNIVDIVRPITKYAKLVDDKKDILFELEKAFYLATAGRQGPVLLDIPMDIQRSEIEPKELKVFKKTSETYQIKAKQIEKVLSLYNNSKRPLILAGGGIKTSQAKKELYNLAHNFNIPVVVSLMGKGSFPEDDPLFAGFIGSYGNRASNIILANSDLLFVLGSRLDTRQTGTRLESFLREGDIIQVDIDENEMHYHRIKRNLTIKSDVALFMGELNKKASCAKTDKIRDWIEKIELIKTDLGQTNDIETNLSNKLHYKMIEKLNNYSSFIDLFCVDIGHNQIISAQILKILEKQSFFTSGGLAPMGYAIPAAIGASFAVNHAKNIAVITGDGGFHIATQAIALIRQYNLPIKIFVLNNQSLGMITQFQDLYFEAKNYATIEDSGYLPPNIEGFAKTYSLKYFMVDKSNMDESAVYDDIMSTREPAIIELFVGGKTKVVPKLEVNRPIEDIGPRLKNLKDYMIIDLYED